MSYTRYPAAGGGGGGTWGSITGTLSAQTDLQTALDAKLAIPSPQVDRAILTSNGAGGTRDNPPTLDSSGNLHGNRDFLIYGGTSDFTYLRITDASVGFHFNTGSPLVTIEGGGLSTFFPDSQLTFGAGAGTGGTGYVLGANTNAFNTAVNLYIKPGDNPNAGGDLSLLPGDSATLAGAVMVGKPSLAAAAAGGFPYMPTIDGDPSGTPTAKTGYAPYCFNPTNGTLWVYDGSAWLSVTLT